MMTDPIADMLTRVRNANARSKEVVEVPRSKINENIARILREEGYIKYYKPLRARRKQAPVIRIFLRYGPNGEKVINDIQRVSKPGIRRYAAKTEIPRVLGGMGTMIISTSHGVMTGQSARKNGIGGELVARVW